MLLELKEFLTCLLPIKRWGQRVKELLSMDVLGFLRHCFRYCNGKPVIATEDGPWYR